MRQPSTSEYSAVIACPPKRQPQQRELQEHRLEAQTQRFSGRADYSVLTLSREPLQHGPAYYLQSLHFAIPPKLAP